MREFIDHLHESNLTLYIGLIIVSTILAVYTISKNNSTVESIDFLTLVDDTYHVEGSEVNELFKNNNYLGFELRLSSGNGEPAMPVPHAEMHSVFSNNSNYYVMYNINHDALHVTKVPDNQ